MTRYQVRYASYAAELLSQLPRSLREPFKAKVSDLELNPHVVGDYDGSTGSYSTSFGSGEGIILYVVSDEIAMVTIFRIYWTKL